jgi:alpha-mannosidase
MRSQLITTLILTASILASLGVRARAADEPAGKATTAADPQGQKVLWIIPHTHWEGAVFKTREEYLDVGLPNILKALNLLKTHPEYRFVLDQVAYVRPFLERFPEEEAAFRKFVAEGRLQITGGNDVMLDVNIPSGESWVRQALYGKGYYQEKLGVNVTVGWGLDTFGHHAQMPQLLKLAGYKSYWFQRGVHGNDVPSEVMWQGIDGTKIPAYWLSYGYGLFYPAPKDLFEFDRYAREQWELLGRHSHWPDRVALAGADVIEPEDTLPQMAEEFNKQASAPFTLRFGVPTDFEAVVNQRPERPVITGELNPVFQGVYSSRIELKQWMRNMERILSTSEKLNALASLCGAVSRYAELMRAWEPVLFNQAHDVMSGTIVDKVYEDTIRMHQIARSQAEEITEEDLAALASKVDTRGEGMPILVFNSLGWPRTDIAEVKVGFSAPGVTDLELRDSTGAATPIQLLETERYNDGGIKDTKVAFIARDVPALGYSLYHLGPRRSASSEKGGASSAPGHSSTTMHDDVGSIENEYYRATFDLWTGAMTKLVFKPGNWDVLSGPANVVAEEQDGGDFWELYGTLNGGRLTAMTRQQGLPPGSAHHSTEWVGGDGVTSPGAVFSEFHIAHPFGSGSFQTQVRMYPGIRRIDIRTQILNNDQFVRYRVLFPTSIKDGRRFDEIPFGAIERPVSQEFPAQNWMDWSDAGRGVALINRGLPGNNIAGETLMLSLLRSTRITAYPFFGGYEPGVSSDLGLELGKRHTFDYAVVPHTGDWKEAAVYRAGLEFNNPLVVRAVGQHAGSLSKRWGLVEVAPANVVVSALKPGKNGTALRVYEAAGQATSGVKIKVQTGINSASEADLLENPTRQLDVLNDTLSFDLGPYQIKTFLLKLKPLGNGR